MKRLSALFALCWADGIPRRSLAVAVIVGSILNLINQGDALWSSAPLDWTKFLLTYLVPYCVATYGAVSVLHRARMASRPDLEIRAHAP
jgi:hypothetical protein